MIARALLVAAPLAEGDPLDLEVEFAVSGTVPVRVGGRAGRDAPAGSVG